MIVATIPLRTKPKGNDRKGWRTVWSRTKKERKAAHTALLAAQLRPPAGPHVVTLTRVSPGTLDDDNLRDSLKGIRDGVADYLGVDDRQSVGLQWRYAQRLGATRYHQVKRFNKKTGRFELKWEGEFAVEVQVVSGEVDAA